ncbi:hypothetical protein Shell_0026 [Staphylothermus hellenicus DSM 12710]|uniref:Uncharacterized protein n=1 Tax=Staphylothermus hellenicus (strain DSM 12710 / JCM 10830 / BK20S6-10-b1 / P8) TaxID=591019 RepID=D7DAI1_STAHD|nr:hypothetical protein Shell_0026 [Staphylothermus hellenicus DSM 12710]
MKNIVSLLIVFAVVFASCGILFHQSINRNKFVIDKNGLKRFLEGQYVSSVGLLRASTTVYPDNITIYIVNDNVLAAKALIVLASPLTFKIIAELNNEYSGGWNGKIDVLLGRDIPDTFYSSYNLLVKEIDGYKVVWEKLNYSSPITDWYNYADLLVYHALDKLLQGSRREAEESFINLTKMWDGYGFRDKAYYETQTYAVYKCALFIYLYRALQYAGSKIINDYSYIYDKCLSIIAKAQDPKYGGIHTDYRVVDGEIVVEGDMNTETTSIVVLALYSNYPKIIGEHAEPTL